jgi:hypothetical protein
MIRNLMSPLPVLKFVLSGAILALAPARTTAPAPKSITRTRSPSRRRATPIRADLEFRNVFQADGDHLEARERYAAMLRETGDLEHSYRQYLRLVEQDPNRSPPGWRWRKWRSSSRIGKRCAGMGSGCSNWPPMIPARM